MQFHQKLFTGILLLLIGMVLGALLMIYRGGFQPDDRAEVKVTEITRSSGSSESGMEMPEVPFRNVAKDLTPSVVYIESSVSMDDRDMPDDDYHDFDDNFWDRFMDRRAQSIGSGVILSEEGYIITNNHVVGEDRNGIRVHLTDKRYFEARVVGRDPSTDIAVLKIDADDIKPAVLGDSEELQVGDWVMAIGNPFQLQSTVTAGIVSALGRDVDIIRDQMPIENFIQTDAAINQGNSGGALVNTHGELIGINTAIATESGTYQGYGFAVPINMAFKIAKDIIEYGSVKRGMLGVSIVSLSQDRAEELGMDAIEGVEIQDVASGGSADNAGIEAGDVVLKVGEHEVNEPNQLQARVAMLSPGEEVTITLVRNGETIEKALELIDRDDDIIASWQDEQAQPYNEMFIEPEDDIEVREFEIGVEVAKVEEDDDSRLIVLQVVAGSPADMAGLRTEHKILEVDDEPVQTLDQIEEALAIGMSNDDELRILIENTDGEEEELTVPY